MRINLIRCDEIRKSVDRMNGLSLGVRILIAFIVIVLLSQFWQ